jgi:AraC-like DNA-binding protein
MLKNIFCALIIPVIALLFAGIYIFSFSTLTIFPDPEYKVVGFSDANEKGKSTVDSFNVTDDTIKMEYTLRSGILWPYAGIVFRPGSFLNLKNYDYAAIRIKSEKSTTLRFIAVSFLKGFSVETKPLSSLYLIAEINVTDNIKSYVISLKDFKVPEWWYTNNNLPVYDKRITPDFSSIERINIENDENFKKNIQDKIVIESIIFSKSRKPVIVVYLLFVLFYFVAYVFFRKAKSMFSQKKYAVIKAHKQIEFDDYSIQETERLVSFLAENYSDPECTVNKVAQLSNIDVLKIPKIIKTRYNLTFPQYLNELRMNEAKRLLAVVNVKIIEIAFAVGFSNVSHFNKHFKAVEKMSPREYRRKHRKSNE